MTIRYVGPGGSDSNDGLSYANRKLTLNGVEDSPVQAGDTVYVAPGTYRESLVLDVSGSSGTPITYVGDVTGAYTDGIGGLVRITGSNDDYTKSRSYCIDGSGQRSWRTFRGFQMDSASSRTIYSYRLSNLVVEDCTFANGGIHIYMHHNASQPITVRRCIFDVTVSEAIYMLVTVDVSPTLFENCLFIGQDGNDDAIQTGTSTGVTVRNCTFINIDMGVVGTQSAPVKHYVRNCLFEGIFYAVSGDEFDVDYCGVTGIHSEYAFTSGPPTLGSNIEYEMTTWRTPIPGLGEEFENMEIGYPEDTSPYRRITDDGNAPDHDLFGMPRPATNGKRSWGAIQYQGVFKETTITRNSSPASLGIEDAGCAQFIIPVMETKVTVSVYTYREANYSGTLPQMIIKRPGQSDITVTDTGSAGQWNLLTSTFIHNGMPEWVAVQLKSNNTATSGNYRVFFEDLELE